jgi:hypothetical protein
MGCRGAGQDDRMEASMALAVEFNRDAGIRNVSC